MTLVQSLKVNSPDLRSNVILGRIDSLWIASTDSVFYVSPQKISQSGLSGECVGQGRSVRWEMSLSAGK